MQNEVTKTKKNIELINKQLYIYKKICLNSLNNKKNDL